MKFIRLGSVLIYFNICKHVYFVHIMFAVSYTVWQPLLRVLYSANSDFDLAQIMFMCLFDFVFFFLEYIDGVFF